MKLDNAFKEQMNIGPVYLFYSVNGSGHFCGVAQMVSPVDYNASSGVWAQGKLNLKNLFYLNNLLNFSNSFLKQINGKDSSKLNGFMLKMYRMVN